MNPPPAEIGASVAEIDTPALIVDLDALDRNMTKMAQAARATGVRLRPHAKTHKCPALARRIAEAPNLRFRGLQAYHGRAQHMATYSERAQAIAFAVDAVRETLDALAAAGLACDTVGGAGTGTFTLEAASGVYNELQV